MPKAKGALRRGWITPRRNRSPHWLRRMPPFASPICSRPSARGNGFTYHSSLIKEAPMPKGYIYRKRSEAPTVPCYCGPSTRIVTAKDTPIANLHVTKITDSIKHYHKLSTEYYYILEG